MKKTIFKLLYFKLIVALFGASLILSSIKTNAQIKDSEIFNEAADLEKELDEEDVFEEDLESESEEAEDVAEEEDAEEELEELDEENEEEEEEVAGEEEEELEELNEEDEEEVAGDEELLEEEAAEEELKEGDEIAVEKGEEKVEEIQVEEESLPEAVPDNLEVIAEEEQEEPVNDEPDLEYEARLFSIYKDFYSDPISDTKWREILSKREIESYNIVRGDNLWNISKIIFGDGTYWPKVWALNDSITNPHLIEPNNKINFILGNEDNPPSFSISEKAVPKDPTAPVKAGVTLSQNSDDVSGENVGVDSDVEIPPPTRTYNPALRNLPPSIPEWQLVGENNGEFNLNGVSGAQRLSLMAQKKTYLTHYILDVKPSFIGEIVEIEENESMAANFQHVYIKVKQGSNKPGDKLLVFQTLGGVERTNELVEKIPSDMGHIIEVQGEVELLDYMSSSDSKSDLFRAKVTKLIYPVKLHSLLAEDSLKKINFKEQGETSESVAQIIGGSQSTKRNLYGYGEFVFLNRGSNEGFSNGQVLAVRSNRKLRYKNSIIKEDVREIARVKIVRAEKHFSTALIIMAKEPILSGDFTGRGSFVMRSGVSSSGLTSTAKAEDTSDEPEADDFIEEDGELEESEDSEEQQSLLEEVDEFEEESEEEEIVEEASGEDFEDDEEEDDDDIDTFTE